MKKDLNTIYFAKRNSVRRSYEPEAREPWEVRTAVVAVVLLALVFLFKLV